MYCIEVWNDTEKRYFPTKIAFLSNGLIRSWQSAADIEPTIYDNALLALEDAQYMHDGNFITCVVHMNTKNHHFDADSLPD